MAQTMTPDLREIVLLADGIDLTIDAVGVASDQVVCLLSFAVIYQFCESWDHYWYISCA